MPSKRHQELQNMVVRWIGNRSFKMCGLPESNVVGYIADFVAIADMRHSGLEKKYMAGRATDEGRERRMFDRWYVCVFEIKVSRSDFLNTFGNKHTPHAEARLKPVGTAHWVVAEKGICKPEELPDFWGLLTPYGSGLTELKAPELHILPEAELHAMAFDMLWLQMNLRKSYYDQVIDMAETIKDVHRAIMKGKSHEELFCLSERAKRACCGFVV